MGKQNVVYTYDGILFSLKNEGDPVKCYTTWMNLEDMMLSEISQSQRTSTTWFHLWEVPKVVKLIETGLPGTGGHGTMDVVLQG